MSACIITTTPRAFVFSALSNASSIHAMAASMRTFASVSCSGVGAVWPVHGARLLFEPTTWTAEKTVFASFHCTFSG